MQNKLFTHIAEAEAESDQKPMAKQLVEWHPDTHNEICEVLN